MKSDIEIARAARLKPIAEIATKIGAPESALRPFGRFIAKLEYYFLTASNGPDGKLILVTAISPTPAGEGKTTTTVGLGDALNRIGRKTIICLREPVARTLSRHEGQARPAEGGRKWCRWTRSTLPFHRRFSRHHIGDTICSRRWSTITCIGATRSGLDQRRVTWRRALDMNDRALARDDGRARLGKTAFPARMVSTSPSRRKLWRRSALPRASRSWRSSSAAWWWRIPEKAAHHRIRSQGAGRDDRAAQGGA